MAWYRVIAGRILKGIVLFIFPLVVLIFILEKSVLIINGLLSPVKNLLPEDRIFGIGILTLISIGIVMIVCYSFGYLAEKKKVQTVLKTVDEGLSLIIPGYAMMKTRAGDAIGNNDEQWKSVLMGEEGDWKIGIEVERRSDGMSMVFFPEPPDAKAGELKLIHQSKLRPLDIPVSKILGIIKKYGKDSGKLL